MLSIIESYFSVLMLFGASQATLSIFLLLKDKSRPFSNNLLALLLFAWGFSCYWFFAFIAQGALFSVTLTTFIGPMLALTLFPPIYLYVKYLFYEHKTFQKKDHLHFLPIYIYLIFTFYLYFDSDFSIVEMRKHDWFNIRRIVCAYVATIQGPFYFFQTNHILKLWQQKIKKDYSEIESRKLEWLKIINYSFALVFIIGGVSTILRSTLMNPYFLYMGYHAVLAVSLFYITVIIYKHPVLFTRNESLIDTYSTKQSSTIELKEVVSFSEINSSDENSNDKELMIIHKIERVMKEQKLYKIPNFNLNDLAESIDESRNAISFALNNHLNKTFYNYINELRIKESKNLLVDKNLEHFSIEGIAAQSGFKTMSVFYRFFKEKENVTPAVYRKKYFNT